MEHSDTVWLTGLEHDLLTCAQESWGILAYAVEHKRPDGKRPSDEEVAAAVLSLVERGWVEVHRMEPWTSPEGKRGMQYGDPIDHAMLPALLADADVWDDPSEDGWIGELTLSKTPAWSAFLGGRSWGVMATWTRLYSPSPPSAGDD